MCGIFGVVTADDRAPDRDRVERSTWSLAHRGPDDLDAHVGPGWGLGHTRLSLLDLSPRSNQPLWDAQRRWCLVYNGEIYNHADLRARLERSGVRFRTTGDTEVLLQALITWGVREALRRLEGMYAFALRDARTGTVVLARDRFGIKPLFVLDQGTRVLFASEVRAFRPWLHLEPDLLSISSYLQGFGGPTTGHTFYRSVRILPPGAVMELRPDHRPIATVHHVLSAEDLLDPIAGVDRRHADDDPVDSVEQALVRAVEAQLVADAPVGALCSGGVDSALIVALAARSRPDLAIFHADVVGRHSERAAAELLARHLGLELHVATVHDTDVVDLIPDVVDHIGRPFVGTPHAVPFLAVSRLVRQHGVKAVLSGEGADECFLGYRWQRPPRSSPRQHLRRVLDRLLGPLPPPVVDGAATHYARVTPESQRFAADLHNRFEVALDRDRRRAGAAVTTAFPTLDALGYNLRALLHRNDAMGMAASIECRFPFLDERLVGLAMSLPEDAKIRRRPGAGPDDKWVLRRVAGRHLPPAVARRPKEPFRVDAFARMHVGDRLLRSTALCELFDLSPAQSRHLAANAVGPLRQRLLQLDVWLRVCLRQEAPSDVAMDLRDAITVEPLPGDRGVA